MEYFRFECTNVQAALIKKCSAVYIGAATLISLC